MILEPVVHEFLFTFFMLILKYTTDLLLSKLKVRGN